MSIKENINKFLLLNGFNLIDQDVSGYFGDYFYTYSNKIINIRLVSDRSIESIDVCSVLDINRWFDLALIKALINDEKELSKAATIEKHNEFLERNLRTINDLFNDEKYHITKKELEELGDRRAKQMFKRMI